MVSDLNTYSNVLFDHFVKKFVILTRDKVLKISLPMSECQGHNT